MGKEATTHIKSKKSMLMYVILGLLGMGIITFYVIDQLDLARDRHRFEEAKQQKASLVSRISSQLGTNVISVYDNDQCFNSEQGPYNNGRLWCQSASIIRLSGNIDFAAIGATYLSLGKAMGLPVGMNSPFPGYWLEPIQGLRCQLEYQDDKGGLYGLARRVPFGEGDKSALAIACADRARIAYYPFVP